jgi:hypothetical protein
MMIICISLRAGVDGEARRASQGQGNFFMNRRGFFSRLAVAVAAAVAGAVVAAEKAQAQGSYYNQRNTQNRDYQRLQQQTRRAFGSGRR